MKVGQAASMYERDSRERSPFLLEAIDCAALTVPSLMPSASVSGYSVNPRNLEEPFQSVGAMGVSSMGSKYALTLFPPNHPFARLELNEAALDDDQLASLEAGGDEAESEIETAFADTERKMLKKFDESGLRAKMSDVSEQLICCGNVLAHLPPAPLQPRTYRLNCYTVKRDPRGNLTRIITKEVIDPLSLEERQQRRLAALGVETDDDLGGVEVFTVVARKSATKFAEWQEVGGKQFGELQEHEADALPYLPLRMYKVDGESYGRSHVARYLGTLRAHNILSMAIERTCVAMAETRFGVNPENRRLLQRLKKSKPMDFVEAREGDVFAIGIDKARDLSVAQARLSDLELQLNRAFMQTHSVQRQAERVTAEEIRLLAADIDATAGGAYANASEELQKPVAKLLLKQMQDEGEIPVFGDAIQPVVVTGLDAVGRSRDLERIRAFLLTLNEAIGPQEAARILRTQNVARKIAIASNVEVDDLIKTAEELEAEAQQAQMAQMAPELIKNPDMLAQAAEQVAASGAA